MTQAVLDGILPHPGSICIIWVGQAGFLIKMPSGKVIAIDPYLSDSVYELFREEYGYGFKRMTAPLFNPGDVIIDYLFVSHEHGDHLDTDAIEGLMAGGRTALYCNAESREIAVGKQVAQEKITVIEKDTIVDLDEFKVIITSADHGELCANALGFVFDFGFTRVYYSGDTAFNLEALGKAIDMKPEVALLPINGAFGNLNASEAARLAFALQACVCIPHHFWTFPLHAGSEGGPMDAIKSFPKEAPECRLVLLTPGEPFIYPA